MTAPNFPDLVRQERARLGWSQDQAARRMGVMLGSYRRLEDWPPTDPRASTLIRLIKAGYRLEALFPELKS